MTLNSNMHLARGAFEPSDRNYRGDHIYDMGTVALEVPSDRAYIVVKGTAELGIWDIAPGSERQKLIVENGNSPNGGAAINITQKSADRGNIILGLDEGDTRTLLPGNNMEFWYDRSRSAWVGITFPSAINGGTFV